MPSFYPPQPCRRCGKMFRPVKRDDGRPFQQFCRRSCGVSFRKETGHARPGFVPCPQCGTPFNPQIVHGEQRAFSCSRECAALRIDALAETRFWSKVDRSSEDGCWPWLGYRTIQGYGWFSIGKASSHASRWAYLFAVGPIADGMYVLHTCDNPPCVRPSHLFLGTARDNARDMVAKKRHNPNPRTHTLTEAQVIDIRRRHFVGESQAKLAQEFGVQPSTISRIVTRKRWGLLL